MTGMYPARLNVTDWIPGYGDPPGSKLSVPDWTMRLEHHHVSIAEALKEAGYKTAHVGKWHLMPTQEPDLEEYFPDAHGFDINIGGNEWGMPGSYFHPYQKGKRRVYPLPPGGQEGDYLTDRLTDEALKIIEQWAEDPFFLYFPYYTVHMPMEGKPELVKEYEARVNPEARHTHPVYAAMLHSLDESVARILAKLKEKKIEDNTVIILTGDNGGAAGLPWKNGGAPTNNAPLRAGKGSVYEGGCPGSNAAAMAWCYIARVCLQRAHDTRRLLPHDSGDGRGGRESGAQPQCRWSQSGPHSGGFLEEPGTASSVLALPPLSWWRGDALRSCPRQQLATGRVLRR